MHHMGIGPELADNKVTSPLNFITEDTHLLVDRVNELSSNLFLTPTQLDE